MSSANANGKWKVIEFVSLQVHFPANVQGGFEYIKIPGTLAEWFG